jgi:hypothetical protein
MITATTDDPLREITGLFESIQVDENQILALGQRIKEIDFQLEFFKEMKTQMLFQRTTEPS